MKTDPWQCHEPKCARKVTKFGDLVCPGHWKMLPRDLRQLLLAEQRKPNSRAKQDRVVATAGLVLAYLETCLIQLPQET